jgi:hypothetical protein
MPGRTAAVAKVVPFGRWRDDFGVRAVALLIVVTARIAAADDTLVVGAAIGAGGQGAATYGAVELSLETEWRGARLGLGGRGVWLDGRFRATDWNDPADAVSAVRLLEVHTPGRTIALAGGALAPIVIANLADGYRAALDDHPRTGARASLATRAVAAELVIDDVLDPAATGGALAVRIAQRWTVRGAALVDPVLGESASEVAVARTWQAKNERAELGGGAVYEPGAGASAIVFSAIERDRGAARISARMDLRAGTGTVGGAFGPLYRLEREALWSSDGAGFGAGAAASIAAPIGWIGATVRVRPALPVVVAVTAGAPMGRWLQGAAWAAVSGDTAATAGELRIAWARRLSSALQIARMYDTKLMDPAPIWSVTAWFAAASN